MGNRQLLALFVCNLVLWTVGNGLTPLLPVYAIQLGAEPAMSGYYLAFANLALALGAFSAGWVSARFKRHKPPFIIATLACIPIAWLIGRAGSFWSLSLLTAAIWALGGLALALLTILAGLSAGEHERGKVFGILSLTSGLGALIGGLASGYIADRWGYVLLFSAVAAFMIVAPLAGLSLIDRQVEQASPKETSVGKQPGLGRSYNLLLSASLVATVAGVVSLLARLLLMEDLGFGAFAISSTTAVGGLASLPIPLAMGWLSDRGGRRIYLYLSYLAGAASLLVLAPAASQWSFHLVAILLGLFVGVSTAVGTALATDLLHPASLGRGLALFSAIAWIGSVIGFTLAGFTLQSLGKSPTLLLGMALYVLAAILLVPIRAAARERERLASTGSGAG